MQPGIFLSLDGVDGAGKSTQVELLCELVRGRSREPVVFRDPGGTLLGEAVRDILLHRKEIPLDMTSEMLLYMASRAQLVQECLRPALAQGKVVIADRYLLANIVYQGYAGGLPPETIRQVGQIATGGLTPDLTFILDVAVDIATRRLRGGKDRLESRGPEYMQRVRDGFLSEARQMPTAVVIDASQSADDVHQQIAQSLQRVLH